MGFELLICDFIGRVVENPRIGPSHISLFVAILVTYQNRGCKSPVSVFSRELMKQAKISAAGTYHNCISDLNECGYIKYEPSYNPVVGSLVHILGL